MVHRPQPDAVTWRIPAGSVRLVPFGERGHMPAAYDRGGALLPPPIPAAERDELAVREAVLSLMYMLGALTGPDAI